MGSKQLLGEILHVGKVSPASARAALSRGAIGLMAASNPLLFSCFAIFSIFFFLCNLSGAHGPT